MGKFAYVNYAYKIGEYQEKVERRDMLIKHKAYLQNWFAKQGQPKYNISAEEFNSPEYKPLKKYLFFPSISGEQLNLDKTEA